MPPLILLEGQRRARDQFFFPCDLDGFLEDFHLHRLLAQKSFQLADPLLESTSLRSADHLVVRLHRHLATFAHELPPSEELIRGDAVLAGHIRDAHPRTGRLLHDPQLLRQWPAPTLDLVHQFDRGKLVALCLDIPLALPLRLGRVYGLNGGYSTVNDSLLSQEGKRPEEAVVVLPQKLMLNQEPVADCSRYDKLLQEVRHVA